MTPAKHGHLRNDFDTVGYQELHLIEIVSNFYVSKETFYRSIKTQSFPKQSFLAL